MAAMLGRRRPQMFVLQLELQWFQKVQNGPFGGVEGLWGLLRCILPNSKASQRSKAHSLGFILYKFPICNGLGTRISMSFPKTLLQLKVPKSKMLHKGAHGSSGCSWKDPSSGISSFAPMNPEKKKEFRYRAGV